MQGANVCDTDEFDEECEDIVDDSRAIEEFKINTLLSVRLDGDGSRMYVKGRPFDQCAYPVLNGDGYRDYDDGYGDGCSGDENSKVPRKAARSVDAFLWKEHRTLDHPGYVEGPGVSMQELFWGLCSTLQAWAENDYDTRLLHVNLAFPLSRALANAGEGGHGRWNGRELEAPPQSRPMWCLVVVKRHEVTCADQVSRDGKPLLE